MIITMFRELVISVIVAGIALMIYPVLNKDPDAKSKERLSVWYMGTRLTESTLDLIVIR